MKGKDGFVEVNGARLYYEIAGSGRPMILIHGFSLDTRMWDSQFETFARYYQVIRYDVRGFGRSDLPADNNYTFPDDLMSLMECLGIPHAYILGLSMGGGIAIDFALEYPEAVDALIPVDTVLGGFQSPEFSDSMRSVWVKAIESGVHEAKDLWLNLDLFKPARKNPDVAARLTQMVADYSGWHLSRANSLPNVDPPAIQRLDKINSPTLVIVGELDLPHFHTVADILLEQIPKARKVIIPGAGHMSNMENPVKFNEAVLRFLEDF